MKKSDFVKKDDFTPVWWKVPTTLQTWGQRYFRQIPTIIDIPISPQLYQLTPVNSFSLSYCSGSGAWFTDRTDRISFRCKIHPIEVHVTDVYVEF